MFPLIIAAAYAAKTIYTMATREKAAPWSPPPPPHYNPAKKIIAFVGAASSGKSSTGNALLGRHEFKVGPEHGTTIISQDVDFIDGYSVRDVPGLLDGPRSSQSSFESLKTVELVVYVCTGQLYRQEIEFLNELHSKQSHWNAHSAGARRQLILFCNKRDVAIATMTSTELILQDKSLIAQVSGIIPCNRVFCGASRPKLPLSPDVSGVERFIRTMISERCEKESHAN